MKKEHIHLNIEYSMDKEEMIKEILKEYETKNGWVVIHIDTLRKYLESF